MGITDKDIDDYFKSKGIILKCPICSHLTFGTNLPALNKGSYDTFCSIKNNDVSFGNSMVFFSLTCNNCGYVMPFNIYLIHDWKKSQTENK